MEKDILRLECLRLAASRTTDQQEVLARADEYVKFVLKDEPKSAEVLEMRGNTAPSPSVALTTGKKR